MVAGEAETFHPEPGFGPSASKICLHYIWDLWGSQTSRLQTSTSCQINNSIRLKIKCTVHVMHLSHPETVPLSMEELSSTQLLPGATKFGVAAFHSTWKFSATPHLGEGVVHGEDWCFA